MMQQQQPVMMQQQQPVVMQQQQPVMMQQQQPVMMQHQKPIGCCAQCCGYSEKQSNDFGKFVPILFLATTALLSVSLCINFSRGYKLTDYLVRENYDEYQKYHPYEYFSPYIISDCMRHAHIGYFLIISGIATSGVGLIISVFGKRAHARIYIWGIRMFAIATLALCAIAIVNLSQEGYISTDPDAGFIMVCVTVILMIIAVAFSFKIWDTNNKTTLPY